MQHLPDQGTERINCVYGSFAYEIEGSRYPIMIFAAKASAYTVCMRMQASRFSCSKKPENCSSEQQRKLLPPGLITEELTQRLNRSAQQASLGAKERHASRIVMSQNCGDANCSGDVRTIAADLC